MSLPLPDPQDPKQTAASTMAAGRFHDVVVGASKLVHGGDPDEGDVAALRWALDLLESAAATDVLFAMPSSRQLAAVGGTVSAIRRAARSSEADVALDRVRDGLAAALEGRRDEEIAQSMATLRALFAGVSRITLQAEVQKQSERESYAWPQPMPASRS